MPVWVSVLSALAVALITAWVTHRFTLTREREKDAREKKRELEREQREHDRDRAVVVADLLERLRAHCQELRPWILQKNPQTPGWHAANQELMRHVDNTDARRVLADIYPELMAAIRYEAKSIIIQQRQQEESIPKIFDERGGRLPRADVEEHHFRAYSLSNVADVLEQYAPIIGALGDEKYSREIGNTADNAHAIAHHMFREV